MNNVYSFSNRDCKHITRKPSLRLIPYINHVLRSRVRQLFYYCGAFGEGLFFDHGSGSCFITVKPLAKACSSITDTAAVSLLWHLWWWPVLRSRTRQLFYYCGVFGESLFFDHWRVSCFITVTPLVRTCSSITDASAVLLLWRLWWVPVLRSLTRQLFYYCGAFGEGLFFDHERISCVITVTPLVRACSSITNASAVLLLWRLSWGPVLRSRTRQLFYYCDVFGEGLFFDHGHVNCFITLTHVLFCFAFANLYSCCHLIKSTAAVMFWC